MSRITKYNSNTQITGSIALAGVSSISGSVGVTGSVQSVLYGTYDNGTIKAIPSTTEGHLEVAIHDPITPFGSLHVESLIPVFQSDAVYGINNTLIRTTLTGSGNAYAADNLFSCSTGTTIGSFGSLQSRRRVKYRPGQGVVGRFTAIFPVSASNSILVAGMGTAECGFYVGYNGLNFGVLHSTRGLREVQVLNVTVPSTTNENVRINLDGFSYLAAVTNSNNKAKTAYEIGTATYDGWTAMPLSESVVFVANSARSYAQTFSASGTTFSGSFTRTIAGSASFDTWVYQNQWNGEKLDGTSDSGVILDPKKGNIYQIDLQYLGFGTVTMKTEVVPDNQNNTSWEKIHTFRFPNSLTNPSVTNPSFPFTMAAYSAGSSTNVSVGVGSFAGFIAGEKRSVGPRFSYVATAASSVTSTAYKSLITVRNNIIYNNKANQIVVNLLNVSLAVKDTTPVTLFLIRNATLLGTPVFRNYSSGSCTAVDTESTTCTFTDNSQLITAISVGETGNVQYVFEDEVTLQPGEYITVAARSATGTSPYVLVNLNTREDQ